MIHPLVSDDVWLEHLRDAPAWEPLSGPTVVVAPHPDDETLGAGGLIASLTARGEEVFVVAATDGENCYEQPAEERSRLALVREAEQRTALARLGVPADRIIRLRLTDSGLHLQQDELTDCLRGIVQPGMHLVAPWEGDFHPDHVACAVAAAIIAKEKGLSLTSYFFWTWHRGTPGLFDDLSAVRFIPNAEALSAKTDALAAHRSQLEHAVFEPILPEHLLGPARWPYEVFLPS